MQLSAEETHSYKPANYTRVAAAGLKVAYVQMCLIASVYACVSVCDVFIYEVRDFDRCSFAGGVRVVVHAYSNAYTCLPVFISMQGLYSCACIASRKANIDVWPQCW